MANTIARTKVAYTLGAIAALVAIFSFLATSLPAKWKGFFLALWIVIPPLWFMLEYRLYRFQGAQRDMTFEEFKYGQELARNLWVGISTILAILYFGRN